MTAPRPRGGDPIVDGVLAAAAGPATPAELAGEQRAVDAFLAALAARPTGAPSPGETRMNYTALLRHKLLTRPVLGGAAVAAVTFGGMSAAAAAGELPQPVQSAAHTVLGGLVPAPGNHSASGLDVAPGSSPSPDPSASPSPDPSASPSPDPSGSPSPDPSQSPSPEPSASLSPTSVPTLPGLAGLCNAWASGNGNKEHATAFQRLIEAAGGADKVTAYCDANGTPTASASPSSSASEPGDGTESPEPQDSGDQQDSTQPSSDDNGNSGGSHGNSGGSHGNSGGSHGNSGGSHGDSGGSHGNSGDS